MKKMSNFWLIYFEAEEVKLYNFNTYWDVSVVKSINILKKFPLKVTITEIASLSMITIVGSLNAIC